MESNTKRTKKLFMKRLDGTIDTLLELRSEISSFEENDPWFVDGLEAAAENVAQMLVLAVGGDADELETDDDGLDDVDDLDKADGELDFDDDGYDKGSAFDDVEEDYDE